MKKSNNYYYMLYDNVMSYILYVSMIPNVISARNIISNIYAYLSPEWYLSTNLELEHTFFALK